MSENLTVKLKKPVTVDGQEYASLTMRELSVDDTILLERQNKDKGPVEQDKAFFAMSCGVVPEVIGKMGSRDWTRLKTRYWETLGNVESGDEPSE
jgi:Phage tail assembly chaperone proteins, E, or 41 or 14